MKICKICKQEKEDWEFETGIDKRYGRPMTRKVCRDCRNTQQKERRKGIMRNMEYNYSISNAQVELMCKTQGEKCAICGQSEITKQNDKVQRLSVDHCHETGKVRGLLCNSCNRKLGVLEDKEWCKKAADYLKRKHRELLK